MTARGRSLTAQVAAGFALIVIVSAALTFAVTSNRIALGMVDRVESEMRSVLRAEVSRISAWAEKAEQDALDLARVPWPGRFLSGGAAAEQSVAMETRLATLLRENPDYFMARFLDASGQEVARVDRRDGHAVVVATPDLQDKSHRDYAETLLSLSPGQAVLTPVNLNREHGEISEPRIATTRALAPVFDETGTRVGGVVINADAAAVLPPARIGRFGIRVINRMGDYLRHPDPDRELSHDRGEAPGFIRDFRMRPDSLMELANRSAELPLPGSGDVVLAALDRLETGPGPDTLSWLVLAILPKAEALSPAASEVRLLAMVVGAVALFACLAGWVFARRHGRQLAGVAAAARKVAGGDLAVTVPVQGSAETMELARAFNRMTAQLGEVMSREQALKMHLIEMNRELERSNNDLEQFARLAAHDLRSPLRALGTLADWIAEDYADAPAEVLEHLGDMQEQVARLQSLTDGLLQYSLAGSPESAQTAVDLEALADDVLGQMDLPGGMHVERRFDMPVIEGGGVEIATVIRNLVQNAVNHHDRDTGTIVVASEDLGEEVVLSVTDDGPGIPEAYHDTVLLPLKTLQGRNGSGGSGLGLAFVSRIADRWSGRVEVRSPGEERGTTVRLVMRGRPRVAFDPDSLTARLAHCSACISASLGRLDPNAPFQKEIPTPFAAQ